MATKKDLIDAQSFSKARLLSAFIGGAPGGKELEPAKPLRAVFAGVALTLMVILAGIFIGLIQPKLPSGWDNNRLIVARDTGARYVSISGTLHPVINTVSARMIVPEGEFKVVSVNQSSLDGVPLGGTLGILGAPDTLPRENALDGSGWRACSTENNTEANLGKQTRAAADPNSGIVVERDRETFIVSGGVSYSVPEKNRTAVLRAAGLDTATPLKVRGEWLALFERGSDLAPIPSAGDGKVSRLGLPVGSVIRPTGGSETDRYLLTQDGKLAPLSQLAHRLYLLGGGSGTLGEEVELGPSEIAELPTADPAGPTDWPRETLSPLTSIRVPCATLAGGRADQRTVLAAASGEASMSAETKNASDQAQAESGAIRISIPKNGGALVRGGTAGTLTLIDSGGVSYAVPGDPRSNAARLGYTAAKISVVPNAWVDLLPAGPALTPEAAKLAPGQAE